MRITKAIWEQKNLGLDCIEVRVEEQDNVETLIANLVNNYTAYQVVKIPSSRVDLLLATQDLGFKLIENSIQLSRNIKKDENSILPKLFQRFEKEIVLKDASPSEVEFIMEQVKRGEVFTADRIYNDPMFTKAHSGNRYYNWITSLIESKCEFKAIVYKNNIIGFSINTHIKDKKYNAIFGGLLKEYIHSGLGFTTIYANMLSIIEQGGTHIVTAISSNNLPMVKLHQLFKFQIKEIEYVLVKHCNA